MEYLDNLEFHFFFEYGISSCIFFKSGLIDGWMEHPDNKIIRVLPTLLGMPHISKQISSFQCFFCQLGLSKLDGVLSNKGLFALSPSLLSPRAHGRFERLKPGGGREIDTPISLKFPVFFLQFPAISASFLQRFPFSHFVVTLEL